MGVRLGKYDAGVNFYFHFYSYFSQKLGNTSSWSLWGLMKGNKKTSEQTPSGKDSINETEGQC